MMKKLIVELVAFFLIVSFTVSCNPTPEKQIIINKNDRKFEEKLKTTPSNQNYLEIPEIITDNFYSKDGKVNIIINAKTSIPNTKTYPVVTVVPKELSSALVEKIAGKLFDGNVYDDAIDINTKSNIESQIIKLKEEINNLKNSNQDFNNSGAIIDPESIDEEISNLESQINELEKEYSSAPEYIEKKTTNFKFKKNEETGYYEMNLDGKTSTGDLSKLFGSYSNDLKRYILSFSSNKGSYMLEEEYTNQKLQDVNLTKEEAEKKAFNLIKEIGLDNMQNIGLYIGNHVGKNKPPDVSTLDIRNNSQCYIFFFAPSINNIPQTFVGGYEGTTTYASNNQGKYSFPWDPEIIEMRINDSGVFYFKWTNPGIIKDTLNSNVQLLQFSEIKKIFIQQMQIKKVDQLVHNADTKKTIININKISLGMMRIAKKDNQEEYLIIPVWDFLGNYIDEKGKIINNEVAYSFLTINAIDGSIIDRGLGY